jgi:hypothetical protein
LLFFFLSALVAQFLSVLTHGVHLFDPLASAAAGVVLFAALTASVVILCMPLRDPFVSTNGISAVGAIPTIHQRSPEDNLRLWQFLSVSWLSPLLSMGKNRQLHEEDVWSLGFEFQHTRLHEKFRQLQGTVVKRLLRANGIDVCIITVNSVVATFFGKSHKNPSIALSMTNH